MTDLHSGRGDLPRLFIYMVAWIVLLSLLMALTGNSGLLPGFLLGAAGSACYVLMLYRQLRASLDKPSVPSESSLRSGWVARLFIVVVILAISRAVQEISFLAALFGFFSFQISIFVYAAAASVYRIFYRKE
jgi:hypothetical protein